MGSPSSHNPGADGGPSCPPEDTLWSTKVSLPHQPEAVPLVRAGAPTCELLGTQEVRGFMKKLSVLAAQLKCGGIVVPKSVSHVAIEGLVADWRQGKMIAVGRSSTGDFIIRSAGGPEDSRAFFAVLSAEKRPLIAGLLTDRDLSDHWPKAWQDYSDLKGKTLLDHCSGLGKKVRLLRQQGIDAHGVDISIFGDSEEGMHFGRAESLPFSDRVFDRVESRMGVLLWGQDNREMCRTTLAEMVRVTKDGGTIRILPARESLLRDLVAERGDLSFDDLPTGCFGAFQLRVQRPST